MSLASSTRFEKMVRSTGKLNATSKKTVMELLEKAREKLPPKPEKKKAAPPVAAVAPVAAADVAPPPAKTAWMDDASPVTFRIYSETTLSHWSVRSGMGLWNQTNLHIAVDN